MDYEQEQLERVRTVIKAALLNPSYSRDIQIMACGREPHASVTVPSSVLVEMLKDPMKE